MKPNLVGLRLAGVFLARHPLFVLLALSAFLYFFRLGSTDLVEWDEALYSIRVQAVAQDHQWLDQSSQAIGGLWTAAHPPLVVWLMAMVSSGVGMNEWGLRLVAALCGIGCILVLYHFVLVLTQSRQLGLWSGTLLLMIPYFSRYARMAQLDVPVLLWILLSLFFFWRGLNGKVWNFVLSGLALGLGLMSKIVVAMLSPLTIIFFLAGEFIWGERKQALRGCQGLILMTLLGLLIALPWHLAITWKWGTAYWKQALGYHIWSRITQPLEGHASGLGFLYWPVQIVVRLGSLFALTLVGLFVRPSSTVEQGLSLSARRFVYAWFLVPFLLFSATATKFHPYLLLFVLPLVVFTALGANYLRSGLASRKIIALVLSTAVACLIFSQTLFLQHSLEQVVFSFSNRSLPPYRDSLYLVLFSLLVWSGMLLSLNLAKRIGGSRGRLLATIFFTLALILPASFTALSPLVRKDSAWIELRNYLVKNPSRQIVLLGQASAVNRFYLSVLRFKTGADWTIRPPGDAQLAELLGESGQIEPGKTVILSRADWPKRPPLIQPVPVFSNKKFVVFDSSAP